MKIILSILSIIMLAAVASGISAVASTAYGAECVSLQYPNGSARTVLFEPGRNDSGPN